MQKKINQMEEENDQDQDNFVKKVKTVFNNINKIEDAE